MAGSAALGVLSSVFAGTLPEPAEAPTAEPAATPAV
jgi:hypothetical protein